MQHSPVIGRNNMNDITQHRRIFCIFVFLLGALIFLVCDDAPEDVNIENYLTFLKVTKEQEPEILPLLEEIRDTYGNFRTKLTQAKNTQITTSDSIAKWKYQLIEQLHTPMRDIKQKLTPQQRSYWAQSEAYYYYQKIFEEVVNYISTRNPMQDTKKVTPGASAEAAQNFLPQKSVEFWTIYFGEGRGSSAALQGRGSAGFPLFIQATLMDQSFRNAEAALPSPFPETIKPDSVIEIRVILRTRLHQNYVDISRWIPYIRIPGGTDIEPIAITKRDKVWFEERGITLFKALPDFLAVNDAYVREESRPMSGRNPVQIPNLITPIPSVPPEMRSQGFEQYFAYYQLFFPAERNGKKIIQPTTKEIELIFLEEIGSTSRSSGTWRFEWNKK